MKRIVIVGMSDSFRYDIPEDTEIWGCNHTYLRQKNLSRLYFFDELSHFRSLRHRDPDFIGSVNALGIPVYTKRHYEEIPNSIEYPIRDTIDYFGIAYFTTTIAYMIADAIKEKADIIILHRIQIFPHADDYFLQKPCLDYWIGRAHGLGIKILKSEDCILSGPHPWEPALYGYIYQETNGKIMKYFSRAVKDALSTPLTFRESEECRMQ